MAAAKSGFLILYVLLLYVAINEPLSLLANFAQGALVLLVALHLVECILYRDIISQAPGSAAWHLLNIMLFGVLHMIHMKLEIRRMQEEGS